jgi:hypothetical protein
VPNNLPLQLTSFVGRESDLAEVKELIAGHRLVTLTGAPAPSWAWLRSKPHAHKVAR